MLNPLPIIIIIIYCLVFLAGKIYAGGDGHGHGHGDHGGGLAPVADHPLLKKNPIVKKQETNWKVLKNGVSISCNQTFIAVYIPHTSIFDENKQEPISKNMIFWNNDGSQHCRSQEFNTTHYIISVNIAEWNAPCGTVRDAETDMYRIKYKNSVSYVPPGQGTLAPLADVDCAIQKDKNVAVLPDSMSASKVETVWGAFEIKTSFYHDSEFTDVEALSTRDAAPKVQVGKSLYGKTEIVTFPDQKQQDDMPEIAVTVLNCIATKSPQYRDDLVTDTDKFTLRFIQDRCVGEDKTVIIKRNGHGGVSEFKFQMFKWKNTINQYVYLHCAVAICNNIETENQCSGQSLNYMCHGDITKFKVSSKPAGPVLGSARPMGKKKRRKKRESDVYENIPSGVIDSRYITIHSFGPIIPWDTSVIAPTLDRTKEEQKLIDLLNHGIDPENPPEKQAARIVIGIVAAFSCVSLLILGSVFYKKFIKTRRWEEFMTPIQQDKNEIQQGFVFVLRSSTDPVLPKDERQDQEDQDNDSDYKERRHRKKKKKHNKDTTDKAKRKKKKRQKSMREDMEVRHKSRRRRTRDRDIEGEDNMAANDDDMQELEGSPSRKHRHRSRKPEDGENSSPRKHRGKSRRPDRETSMIPEEPEPVEGEDGIQYDA